MRGPGTCHSMASFESTRSLEANVVTCPAIPSQTRDVLSRYWLHMYVCCCEPSLDMYALCGPETYGPFLCDLLLHTYAYVDFALMYGWIYVLLDICLLVMVMYCWIYIYLLDICAAG